MNKILILFTCGILFLSCAEKDEELSKSGFKAGNLKQLVLNAISGNTSANDTLSKLFDYSLPLPGEINKVIIDSISLPSGITYYSVLIETPNPVYNRFAVYDSKLNLYLADKSLNGNLTQSKTDTSLVKYFAIKERFLSKDVLILERLSLYKVDDSSTTLSFRIFTKMIKHGIEYTQNIDEITSERIKTSIKSSKASAVNNKADVFNYDNFVKTYLSSKKIFDFFVLSEVKNFNIKVKNPQISDENSALESVGVIPGIDTIKSKGKDH